MVPPIDWFGDGFCNPFDSSHQLIWYLRTLGLLDLAQPCRRPSNLAQHASQPQKGWLLSMFFTLPDYLDAKLWSPSRESIFILRIPSRRHIRNMGHPSLMERSRELECQWTRGFAKARQQTGIE